MAKADREYIEKINREIDIRELQKALGEVGVICASALARAEQAETQLAEIAKSPSLAGARAEIEALRKRVGELEDTPVEVHINIDEKAKACIKELTARAKQAVAQLAVAREALENIELKIKADGGSGSIIAVREIARAALQQTAPATVDSMPCEGAEFGPT